MAEGPSAATKSAPPDPLIGRVIADRFRLTSLIARGGMGKVYLAEQAPLGRHCAIKVLNPNYSGDADPEFQRRFFREASITSQIKHPNCVTIFDYGKTDDDILYMAMEYLEGQTLHQVLRAEGVMHEIRAGRIAAQICRALREAHRLGVIHRDLKPANIFVMRPTQQPRDANGSVPPPAEEDEDFVKVLDFGLVKHVAERPEEQLTQTGLFMGSPKYMAPEQIQGGQVDERTDIYSLGIIMYEMLAGKVPFERATSVNILMAHVGEAPPPMRAVNPNLVCSPGFEELVMSCIAKEPSDRLSSMDHVLQAIRRVHGGSLTGPVAALHSGQYSLPKSVPPPPLLPLSASMPTSSPPMALTPPMPGVAPLPPHGPLPVMAPPPVRVPSLSAQLAPRRQRSKLWILFGVFVAAVLGGGLGMLTYHWTSAPALLGAPPPPGTVTAPPVTANPADPAPSAPPAPAPAPPPTVEAPAAGVVFEVTTDPPGASVREDGKEICPATPCRLSFHDDGSKPHKLTILRAGQRTETRTVKASDPPLHLKLSHLGGNASGKSKSDAPTPSGFKDQPY